MTWPDGSSGLRLEAFCPEHGLVNREHLQWGGKDQPNLCWCGRACDFVSLIPFALLEQAEKKLRERSQGYNSGEWDEGLKAGYMAAADLLRSLLDPVATQKGVE